MAEYNGSISLSEVRRPSMPAQLPVGGSFAERLAARAAEKGQVSPLRVGSGGFRAVPPSRIITPQAKPGAALTVPQGVSPATLLESPVLVSTNQAEPSPTTGTFPFPLNGGGGRLVAGREGGPAEESNGVSGFVFRNSLAQRMESGQLSPLGGGMGRLGQLLQQAAQTPPITGPTTDAKTAPPGEEDGHRTPPLIEKPAEDGYNWRKYGQKQVKGSEHPRSYYKCTHPGCNVKKKVERSEDGHVIERVYKGTHSHPQPTPARRVSVLHALGSGNITELARVLANGQSFEVTDGLPGEQGNRQGWAGVEPGRARGGSPAGGDVPAGGGASQRKQWSGSEQDGDQVSGSSDDSGDEGEGGNKRGADDGLEPDGKRRKNERKGGSASIRLSHQKGTREPRLVIQARSEVEILDDGYRWRKYGQKVVKGNPHPRSYYKCTSAGCPVRKHVERSSADAKEVITTYEGKHNHDVPALRGVKDDRDTLSTPGSGISTSNLGGLPTPLSTGSEPGPGYRKEPTCYGGLLDAGGEAERYAGPDDAGMSPGDGDSGSPSQPSGISTPQSGLLDSDSKYENGIGLQYSLTMGLGSGNYQSSGKPDALA